MVHRAHWKHDTGRMPAVFPQQSAVSTGLFIKIRPNTHTHTSFFPGAVEWNHAGWGDLVCVGMKAERDQTRLPRCGCNRVATAEMYYALMIFLWFLWSFITNVHVIFCGWLTQMFVLNFQQLRIYDLILLCGINFNQSVWYWC